MSIDRDRWLADLSRAGGLVVGVGVGTLSCPSRDSGFVEWQIETEWELGEGEQIVLSIPDGIGEESGGGDEG